MTLIYQRDVDGPATHAFVVGCGRYPGLDAAGGADRKAPIAGALAVADMLIAERDKLAARLGSIEMLLSDPAATGTTTDIGQRLTGTIATQVEPADEKHFRDSGEKWLNRMKPGDIIIFYFSGHGITDRVGGAVGLLGDVGTSKHRAWAQTFSVTKLAVALRTMSAESAWVFFDACQDLAADFGERLWDVNNIELKEVTLRDVVEAGCDALVLAGAATGRVAWAPDKYEPPFFTQVLLKGLSGCCVERTRAHGWAVTGVTLLYDLIEVGRSVIDGVAVQAQSLAPHSERKVLLAIDRPFTPVTVRSNPEAHLQPAAAVRLMHGSNTISSGTAIGFVWRADVDFVERELTVYCDTGEGASVLTPQTFRQQLPAHNITLVPERRT